MSSTLEGHFHSLLCNQGQEQRAAFLSPGSLTLICCNRASTLNTQHIDVPEHPGGSLPFLVKGAWHAGRERRCVWHACRVTPLAGHNRLSAKDYALPKDQEWAKRTEVPLDMPQNERGHRDREGTLSSRDTVDTAVHV